jgi:hypothetical protein
LCGLLLSFAVMPQTAPDPNQNDGSPYGGLSLNQNLSTPTGPLAPGGGTGICVTNRVVDPCVLTGQYNRYRNSTSVYESTLGGYNASNFPSNFGLAHLYQFNSALPYTYKYEPMAAQPLYITNVDVPGAPSTACNDTQICNLMIAVTLNDYVYAFDTSQTSGTVAPLWSDNLIGLNPSTGQDNSSSHCGQNDLPFANNFSGLPGGSNLAYYGAVATPVIDVNTSLTGGDPILHVVSACVMPPSGKVIQWFLDAIDLTTGETIGTIQLHDPTTNRYFNSPYELSRASVLLTRPDTGSIVGYAAVGTYIYVAFGAGGAEVGAEKGNTYAYSGALLALGVQYSGSGSSATVTYSYLPLNSATTNFYTECVSGSCPATGVYPSPVYTNYDNMGYGTQGSGGGPSDWTSNSPQCTGPLGTNPNCSPGANWGVDGGGIWQSSFGPASNAEAQLYAVSGNGGFACTGSNGSQQCTSPGNVAYFGESAVAFPSGVNPNVSTSNASQSGLSATGTGWCELTATNGAPLIPAIALVYVNAGVVQNSQFLIYQGGANYTSAPTTASAAPSTIPSYGAGNVTCSGPVSLSVSLTSLAALSPIDFYAPYVNTYATDFPGYDGAGCPVTGPPCNNPFLMTQELSRLDLDLGVCGPVIIEPGGSNPGDLFMMTCDKVSNLYVMPTPEVAGVSLGMFQTGDAGLVNGTTVGSNIYQTEAPLKITRSTTNCETVDQPANGQLVSNGQVSGTCDEVHSVPWFNDLAVVWPTSESVELFQGSLNVTNPNGLNGTTYQYTFGAGPAYDPCVPPNQSNCSGSNPPFPPASGNSHGGLMAIAASNQQPPATLWVNVPLIPSGGAMPVGSLYAYSITFQSGSTGPSLTKIYQWNNNGATCPAAQSYTPPPISGWFTPSFTEPTLANGSVYVTTVCGVNNGTNYANCGTAGSASAVESGVIGFNICP